MESSRVLNALLLSVMIILLLLYPFICNASCLLAFILSLSFSCFGRHDPHLSSLTPISLMLFLTTPLSFDCLWLYAMFNFVLARRCVYASRQNIFFSRAIEPLSVHCYVYIHNKCHVLQKQANEKQKKNFRARFHVPRNWQENITFI